MLIMSVLRANFCVNLRHRGINLRPLFLQVNAGAILIMSLLQRHIHPEMCMASKFDYLLNYYSRSEMD